MRVFLDSSQPCRSLRYSAAIMCDCVLTENGATRAFEWYGACGTTRYMWNCYGDAEQGGPVNVKLPPTRCGGPRTTVVGTIS